MGLGSPQHALVGATDVARTAAFLRVFGFEVVGEARLDAEVAGALYGLDGAATELLLAVPGAGSGQIRVVATPHAGSHPEPYALGATAIDLYTRDIDRSLALAVDAGARCGPVGRYEVGPLALAEARVLGPDGLPVVLLQADRRRPSILDADPDRLHSEVHSVVHAVPSVDAAAPFWSREAGLTVLLDATLSDPHVAAFLELPDPAATLRLCLFAAADCRPSRLELITYVGRAPEEVPNARPLRGGLHGPAFLVDDLEATAAALPGAEWSTPLPVTGVLGSCRALAGLTPGGVPVELWARTKAPAHVVSPG